MIKILFEVSEDYIRENASPETAISKMKEDGSNPNPMKALVYMMSFSELEKQIDEGKTEFVVTPDKLDDKSNMIYDNIIGVVCSLATFSEIDNKKEESDE